MNRKATFALTALIAAISLLVFQQKGLPGGDGKEHLRRRSLLGHFEREQSLTRKWEPYYNGELGLSSEHVTQGEHSCRLLCPQTPENTYRDPGLHLPLTSRDWSSYDLLRFDVFNTHTSDVVMVVRLDSTGGKRCLLTRVLPAGAPSEQELPLSGLRADDRTDFDLQDVGALSLYVSCPKQQLVLFFDNVRLVSRKKGALDVPELSAAIERINAAQQRIEKGLRGLDTVQEESRSLKDEWKGLKKRLTRLRNSLRSARALSGSLVESLASAEAIESELATLRESVTTQALRERILSEFGDVKYGIAVESSLTKVFRETADFHCTLADSARLALCRNEHEGFQLVLLPFWKPLQDVRIKASELRAKTGSGRIPKKFLRAFRVEYVNAPFSKTRPGYWPDILVDEAAFDVEHIQPVWIDLFVPPKTPPGVYEGTLTVEPANARPFRLSLEVTVWDFTLPVKHNFKTAYSFSENAYKGYYASPLKEPFPPEVRKQLYDFLLDHRVSPTCIYSSYDRPFPYFEDLDYLMSRGLDTLQLGRLNRTDEYGDFLREITGRLEKKGWLEIAYVYGPDEIQYKKNYAELKAEVKKACEFVHELCPELKIAGAIDLDPELHGYLDIWCPVLPRFDPASALEYQQKGDEVWLYTCGGAWFRPGLVLDQPALDPRIIPWICWKYGLSGFLYYWIDMWGINAKKPEAERWPNGEWDASYHHDRDRPVYNSGILIYPGGEFGQLRSSIRFENVRDGLEDYEYLCLLREKARQLAEKGSLHRRLLRTSRALLQLDPALVESHEQYTEDPELLREYRRRIAETIEKLNAALGE